MFAAPTATFSTTESPVAAALGHPRAVRGGCPLHAARLLHNAHNLILFIFVLATGRDQQAGAHRGAPMCPDYNTSQY